MLATVQILAALAVVDSLRGGARRTSDAPAPAAGGGAPAAVPPPAGPLSFAKHGMDWSDGVCSSRDLQSPINFDDHIKDPPSAYFGYTYPVIKNKTLTLDAEAGTLHVYFPAGEFGGVSHEGTFFPLVRLDFKIQGEHLIHGERLPLEIQMVHRQVDRPTKFLNIAVRVWAETTPKPPRPADKDKKYYPPDPAEMDYNDVIQHFLKKEPPSAKGDKIDVKIKEDEPLDLNEFIVNSVTPDGTFIAYTGSMTTPPCMETVTWLVRRQKMMASNGQIKAISDAIMRLTDNHGNFRATMPFNDRKLSVLKAQKNSPTEEAKYNLMPAGPNPRDDKEYTAMGFVNRAQEAAEQSMQYFDDFADRVRRAGQAHADIINKPLRDIKPWDKKVEPPPPKSMYSADYVEKVKALQRTTPMPGFIVPTAPPVLLQGSAARNPTEWSTAKDIASGGIFSHAQKVKQATNRAVEEQVSAVMNLAAEAAQKASQMAATFAAAPGPVPAPAASPGPSPFPSPGPGPAPAPAPSGAPGAAGAPGAPGPAPAPSR